MKTKFGVLGSVFCVILIFSGIICFSIGNFLSSNSNLLKQHCTESARGIVVDLSEKTQKNADGKKFTCYYPIIEYKAGEETVRKELPSGSSPSRYSINDRIDILYNPDRVEEIVVVGDDLIDSFSKGFKIAGIFNFAILGGIIIVYKKSCIKDKEADEVDPINFDK